MNTTREKAIKFIGHFLSWYQDSFGMPDVVNRLKLEELVKEAESIHTDKIKEMYVELEKKYRIAKQVKRVSSRT